MVDLVAMPPVPARHHHLGCTSVAVLVVQCTYWVERDLLVAFSWLHVVSVLVVALCGLTFTV